MSGWHVFGFSTSRWCRLSAVVVLVLQLLGAVVAGFVLCVLQLLTDCARAVAGGAVWAPAAVLAVIRIWRLGKVLHG